MSLGRRKVGIDDRSAWIFNRMVDAYAARPPYPAALVDGLAGLAGPPGGRIGDLGAGIGHLALPLAERGYDVVAVEPAEAMLDHLRRTATERGLDLRALHGAAERLPIDGASLDLAVIADALHFMDAELTAGELARVLAPGGVLALVTCEFAPTPFMRDLVTLMQEAAPRRPRDLARPITHLAALTEVAFGPPLRFHDQTPVDHPTLDRILRSISFIGPAMNAQRFAALRQRVHALSPTPVWGRVFVLRWGSRDRARRTAKRARREAARQNIDRLLTSF
jgi:SAM-dependent methyltransferase